MNSRRRHFAPFIARLSQCEPERRTVAALAKQAQVPERRSLIASAYFWLA